MSLPTIISLSEDALRAVPNAYKEASLALGGQPLAKPSSGFDSLRTIRDHCFYSCWVWEGPSAETMTVLMATGNAPALTFNFLEAIQNYDATIAIELGEVPYNTTHYYALFVIGFVLFVMTSL